MKFIKFDQVVIPENRQRREFLSKDLEDLRKSILSKGLMHALVVRNDEKTLVAGERRHRALAQLYLDGDTIQYEGKRVPLNMVPVIPLGDLSDLDVREAELEENTHRSDLTWQEKAKAINELHELRMAQNPEHTQTETIEEVAGTGSGSSATNTRDSIILAEHLDNPDVASAKTQKDAIKVVRKIKEKEHRAELAEKFDMSKTQHTVRHGDMKDEMLALDNGVFDLIITDPPYGMGADKFGDMASTGHNYEDSWKNAEVLYRTLAVEGFRVCKEKAHLYTFTTFENFRIVSDILRESGWSVWTRPIIWDKGNGMLPRPKHGPKYTYECICFANKGDKETLKVGNDILRISPDANIQHGAQKPVALYAELISRSCLPGSEVLDPFGGSGTVLTACTNLSSRATMFELEESNFNIALERLNRIDEILIDL